MSPFIFECLKHLYLKYDIYMKQFNREQGLMQIDPTMAIKRYKEDKIKPEDAVLFIRQPKRNTAIGTELFKEYAVEIYKKYSGDIEKVKNDRVYNGGGSEYWKKIFEECYKLLERDSSIYWDETDKEYAVEI